MSVSIALGLVLAAPIAAIPGSDPQDAQEAGELDGCELTLEGESTTVGELPASIGEWPRKAVQTWAPFAEQRGLGMHLADGGRVLLLQRQKLKPKRNLTLVAETAELVDRWFPAPERAPSLVPEAPPVEEVPEGEYYEWSYESDSSPLESETAVLIQVVDQGEYEAVLAFTAREYDYLQAWAPEARQLTGFILERPLVACWQERPDGMEEWDIENELVHRLSQLLVLRRFSQLPYWLTMGLAWAVEDEVRGGIYCFPYRSGFVFATEHGDWWTRLRNETKRLREPFTLDLVASWKRGTYQPREALFAYGTARFLTRHFEPQAVAAAFEELRLLKAANGRVDHGDGTWSLVVGWEVPAVDQARIFEGLRPDFVSLLEASFKKGKSYKLPRRD
ncbi:MAG: hypothetical protein WD226_10795 [Planctomycetota bacterium]